MNFKRETLLTNTLLSKDYNIHVYMHSVWVRTEAKRFTAWEGLIAEAWLAGVTCRSDLQEWLTHTHDLRETGNRFMASERAGCGCCDTSAFLMTQPNNCLIQQPAMSNHNTWHCIAYSAYILLIITFFSDKYTHRHPCYLPTNGTIVLPCQGQPTLPPTIWSLSHTASYQFGQMIPWSTQPKMRNIRADCAIWYVPQPVPLCPAISRQIAFSVWQIHK